LGTQEDAAMLKKKISGLFISITVSTTAFAGGTSYEYQLAGFISASAQTFVRGEYTQIRQPLNIPYSPPTVCGPSDYKALMAATDRQSALQKFEQTCKAVNITIERNTVKAELQLPQGHCETLKNAFDHMLADKVFASKENMVEFEYKNARYFGSRGDLARSAKFETSCEIDGSFRIRAARK
jgi:hypothetical protein